MEEDDNASYSPMIKSKSKVGLKAPQGQILGEGKKKKLHPWCEGLAGNAFSSLLLQTLWLQAAHISVSEFQWVEGLHMA